VVFDSIPDFFALLSSSVSSRLWCVGRCDWFLSLLMMIPIHSSINKLHCIDPFIHSFALWIVCVCVFSLRLFHVFRLAVRSILFFKKKRHSFIHSFSPFFSFCSISLAHVLVSDLTIVVPVSSTPMIFFVSLRENVFFLFFGFFRYL
jgi:hypothetical protein